MIFPVGRNDSNVLLGRRIHQGVKPIVPYAAKRAGAYETTSANGCHTGF